LSREGIGEASDKDRPVRFEHFPSEIFNICADRATQRLVANVAIVDKGLRSDIPLFLEHCRNMIGVR